MKKVNPDDLVNWWLDKYHNTNLTKVLEHNPEWKDNPSNHARDFYQKYSVTQKQHDEWQEWAKEHVRKITKLGKKMVDRGWVWIYLDCAPNVREDEQKL